MEGLDETIAPLIEAMNRVAFIETLSSCGGHPEESSVQEYGYAVGNVVFEIEDEPQNAIRWYGMLQDVLLRRKKQQMKRSTLLFLPKSSPSTFIGGMFTIVSTPNSTKSEW